MDVWHDVAEEWRSYQNNLRYHGLVPAPVKKGHSFMKLMPHQQKAVDDLHNGAVLVGDVGVGKTITALTYFYTKVCGGTDPATGTMRTPMDLYVITTAKKRDSLDWQGDAASLGISDDREKSVEAIKLTVDSWNNIGKYTEVKDAFFIFDEQRLVGSGHWSKSFIKIAKHNKWILLSATPGDTWLDYIPVFVANGFYKNRTDFKRQHCVYNTYTKFPKVERYVGVGKLVRNKRAVLVEMPYLRHTVRHNETIKVAHDKQLFDKAVKDRWHVYENRPIRDVAELFHVMRKVVNYDVSRLEEIQKLLIHHPKLIVFYNFDYELERLRELKNWNPSALEHPSRSSTSEYDSSRSSTQQKSVGTRKPQSLDLRESSNGTSMPIFPFIPETISDSKQKNHSISTKSNGVVSVHPEGRSLDQNQPVSSRPRGDTTVLSESKTSTCRSAPLDVDCVERTEDSNLRQTTSLTKSRGTGPITVSQSMVEDGWPSQTTKSDVICARRDITQSMEAGPVGTDDSQSRTTSGRTTTTSSSTRATQSCSVSNESYPSTNGEESLDYPSFQVAEWNGHKHEPIPSSDSWVYLVQYVAGSEGWNCVETDAVCFYSQTYSYKNFHQAHGRIDRLNTPYTDLWYYSLISDSLIDKGIAKALKNKKNFNEKKFGHFG